MEYRRFPNSLHNRKYGCDTLLSPQLEDYDVFSSGCSPSPYDPPPSFKLVLNVSCLSPEEVTLTFPEDKILQVSANHEARRFSNIAFARDCTIRFVIPEDVDNSKLVATWYSDQFLQIWEGSGYSGLGPGAEATESSVGPDVEATESTDGQSPGAVTTRNSSRSCPDIEAATESSSGSCSGTKSTEHSGGQDRIQNSKNSNDDESGSVDVPPVSPSTRDCNPEEGPKDVKILKPVIVGQNLKPFIDVEEIRELMADLRDKAALFEQFLVRHFFTTPNVARQKSLYRNNPLLNLSQ